MALTVRQSYLLGTIPEAARTVAPAILRKRVMTSQPQYAAQPKINAAVIQPSLGKLITASGAAFSATSKTLVDSVGAYGKNYKTTALDQSIVFPCSPMAIGTGDFTIFLYYYNTAEMLADYYHAFGTSASYLTFAPRHKFTSYNAMVVLGASTLVNPGISASAPGLYKVVIRRRGTQVSFRINNSSSIGATSSSDNVGTLTAIVLGTYSPGVSTPEGVIADFYLAGVEARAWSDGEVNAYVNNPYQIFLAPNAQPWVATP